MKQALYTATLLISLFSVAQTTDYEEVNIPQFMPQGWSLIGFNCIESSNTEEAFSEIIDRVVIVKDYAGNAYLPDWGFNGIGELLYPRGYQIKLTEEILDFSFCPTIIQIDTSEELLNLTEGQSSFSITQNIENEPVDRMVYLMAPNNISTESNLPLVFMFHGAGGNGASNYNNPHLNELISDNQFIGVYPDGHMENGVNGFWNLGSEPTTANDVEFIQLVMDHLSNFSNIDLNKVYAIGMSNGGGMVNLLGKSTTIFKAIAPLFSQQIESVGVLEPLAPLSIFQVNGTEDGLIPIEGGSSAVGEFLSAENSTLNWVNHFNCENEPIEEALYWASTSVSAKYYINCNGNNEVRQYFAHETEHGFTNGASQEAGLNNIWEFFQNF